VYRVNRIPDRHRRKFLALVGFSPAPPHAAHLPLQLSLGPGEGAIRLPAGVSFDSIASRLTVRTTRTMDVQPVRLEAVQTFDGSALVDRTRSWRVGQPVAAFGDDPSWFLAADPEATPALYLGFAADEPLGDGAPLSMWVRLRGPGSAPDERRRILEEARRDAERCLPWKPAWTCPPDEGPEGVGVEELPPHHSVHTVWEYGDVTGWHPFPEEALEDETRGLTLDGAVTLPLPAAMDPVTMGTVSRPLLYVRCRLVAGPPDAAPVLGGLYANAVLAEQTVVARESFAVAPGASVTGQTPDAGDQGELSIAFDKAGRIGSLSFGEGLGPALRVLDYVAPTAAAEGRLVATLRRVGSGNGAPSQRFVLPDAPVSGDDAELWTAGSEGMERWTRVPDLDAAGPADRQFTLDATTGGAVLGDGERGRVAPPGVAVLATYLTTAGAAGNIGVGATWRLSEADVEWNAALVEAAIREGELPPATTIQTLIDALGDVANPAPSEGGADAEDLEHAAGRAAAALWAHERLVELCPSGAAQTLDQLDPALVRSRVAPARAVTLLDFERLALSVPGVRCARARAWAGLDPDLPCLRAPGTVTLVVVPELPAGRPSPTAGLLRAVRRYLWPRRAIGTRLVVVGPTYVEVTVRASVKAAPGARPDRVTSDIRLALDRFLDPLAGGPRGRGWPFGRDVYRSEVLQQIDQVAGVDHVLSLELASGTGQEGCLNVCVGPTSLVAAGDHTIEAQP
jgi:predicted phage baseplate assembly protein